MSEYLDLLIGESSFGAIRIVSQSVIAIILVVSLLSLPPFFRMIPLVTLLFTDDEVLGLKGLEILLIVYHVS